MQRLTPIRARWLGALAVVLALGGCGAEPPAPRDTLVIAAVGEPGSLLPPLVRGTVGRDVTDRIFERLADLAPGASPVDPDGYRPALAESWERVDGRRWRFHLRRDVTWHDGAPFTAADVVFSFDVFTDATIDALARASLEGLEVTAVDPRTVDIAFPSDGNEQLYDATYHVRMLPRHLWADVDRSTWNAQAAQERIVGTGPYRLVSWDRPATLRLTASGMNGHQPGIATLVWTFQNDPDAAANQVLSGAADLIEAMPPMRLAEAEADTGLTLIRYPSAVYGFLAFNLDGAASRASLADRRIRRALAQAIDRQAMAQVVAGPGTAVPRGPLSGLLWINDDAIRQLDVDTAGAGAVLAGANLDFDILVPATSGGRRRLAEALQEAWRRHGVSVTVSAVDFPIFLERVRQGEFDTYLGAFLDEPSARGLAEQWTRAGWDAGNAGHYFNPAFDSLVGAATAATDPNEAKAHWVEALSILNEDAAALFLFNPVNTAVATTALGDMTLNPYAWLDGVESWTLR